METYFTSELLLALKFIRTTTIKIHGEFFESLSVVFIDRTRHRPNNVSVSSNIARVTLLTLLFAAYLAGQEHQ